MRFAKRLIAAFCLIGAPAAAQTPKPDLPELSNAERPLLPALAEVFAILQQKPTPDLKLALTKLDAILPKVNSPTPLRAAVQMMRAETLISLQRVSEATVPIEEAIRLMPDAAGPKMMGSFIYTYTSNVSRAADLWLAGSREEPELARQSDNDMMTTLLDRLYSAGDFRRRNLIKARLVEIGFEQGDIDSQSTLAVGVIRTKMRARDVAGAKAIVPSIVVPAYFVELLIDNEFRPIWPTIEGWAGSRLEKQWAVYFDQLKHNWEASNDLKAGYAYARALNGANRPAKVVELFLKATDVKQVDAESFDLSYLVPTVAVALARTGRNKEAIALLSRFEKIWPVDSPAQSINFSANIARLQLDFGDASSAATTIDRALGVARVAGAVVNQSALVKMHLLRACAYSALGRRGAEDSLAAVIALQRTSPSTYLSLLICENKIGDARNLLIASMDDPEMRSFVLQFVQPHLETYQMPRDLAQKPIYDSLRQDPAVLRAVKRQGRVLTFPINDPGPLPQ